MHGNSKLSLGECMNVFMFCLSLCCPVMYLQPVQGVLRFLQPAKDRHLGPGKE